MKIIAVANQKGGVGKTTLTRELSACCTLRGYETLVIDCDPQGNLTSSWVDADVYEATLAHVLIEPEPSPTGSKSEALPLEDTIVESPVESLDLVPSDIRLVFGFRRPRRRSFLLGYHSDNLYGRPAHDPEHAERYAR